MKLHIRQILFIGLGLLAYTSMSAQHTYTLDECIDKALKNNVRIKNADNDLSAAKHGSKEAFTKYFPSVSATGGGFMANKGLIQMEMVPGTEMSMLKNGIVGGVSASMPLFTGGQIVNANKLSKINIEVNRLQRGLSANAVQLTTEQLLADCHAEGDAKDSFLGGRTIGEYSQRCGGIRQCRCNQPE